MVPDINSKARSVYQLFVSKYSDVSCQAYDGTFSVFAYNHEFLIFPCIYNSWFCVIENRGNDIKKLYTMSACDSFDEAFEIIESVEEEYIDNI